MREVTRQLQELTTVRDSVFTGIDDPTYMWVRHGTGGESAVMNLNFELSLLCRNQRYLIHSELE